MKLDSFQKLRLLEEQTLLGNHHAALQLASWRDEIADQNCIESIRSTKEAMASINLQSPSVSQKAPRIEEWLAHSHHSAFGTFVYVKPLLDG